MGDKSGDKKSLLAILRCRIRKIARKARVFREAMARTCKDRWEWERDRVGEIGLVVFLLSSRKLEELWKKRRSSYERTVLWLLEVKMFTWRGVGLTESILEEWQNGKELQDIAIQIKYNNPSFFISYFFFEYIKIMLFFKYFYIQNYFSYFFFFTIKIMFKYHFFLNRW